MSAVKAHTVNHCRLQAAVVCVNERDREVYESKASVGLMKYRLPAYVSVFLCVCVCGG